VPVLLDYRNIKLEQLFVWHPELAATVTDGAPMSLGKYLRFDAQAVQVFLARRAHGR